MKTYKIHWNIVMYKILITLQHDVTCSFSPLSSNVLPEKLTEFHVQLNEYQSFLRNPNFHIDFMALLILSQLNSVQITSYFLNVHFNIKIPFTPGFSKCYLRSGFQTNIWYWFLTPMSRTCSANSVLFNLISLIFDEEKKL
jgi:hypothetical protein